MIDNSNTNIDSFISVLPAEFLAKLNKQELGILERAYKVKKLASTGIIPASSEDYNFTLLFASHRKFRAIVQDKQFLNENRVEGFWKRDPMVLVRLLLFFASSPYEYARIPKQDVIAFFGNSTWMVNGKMLLKYGWIVHCAPNTYHISVRGKKLLELFKLRLEREFNSVWYSV